MDTLEEDMDTSDDMQCNQIMSEDYMHCDQIKEDSLVPVDWLARGAGMTIHQLKKCLSLMGFPPAVCCADQLPVNVRVRPYTCIVNTDASDLRGSHWVVFHFPAEYPLGVRVEFFDSLGSAPGKYQHYFDHVMGVNGPEYASCSFQIQRNDTDTCGLYCLMYYFERRIRGIALPDIMKEFSPVDLDANERKVLTFYHELINRWLKLYFVFFFFFHIAFDKADKSKTTAGIQPGF